jgi:hypothetical protein
VNTYDPADGILYLHVAPFTDVYGLPAVGGGTQAQAGGQGQVVPYPPGEAQTSDHPRALLARGRSTHDNA